MKTLLFAFTLILSSFGIGQTGGENTFQLLNLGYSARAIGLGTDFISVKDADINLGVGNPALLNPEMHKTLGVNNSFFAEGINYGMAAYGFGLKNEATMSAHIRYVSYGEMTRREINGVENGTFSPGEFIVGAGYAKQINPKISVGANLNLLYSHLENYSAAGAGVDLSGVYYEEKSNLLVTAMVKNAGIQFKNYIKGEREALPAEFQMAVSHKLKHAPFRFSLLAHHLNQWDLTYVDPTLKPTIDPLSGDTIPVKYDGFGKKLFHHLTLQTEVILGKHVHLRAAFDYHKREELKLVSRPGLAGFSFGTGFYFKKFSFDYGISVFSRAGALHAVTFTTNLGKWKGI